MGGGGGGEGGVPEGGWGAGCPREGEGRGGRRLASQVKVFSRGFFTPSSAG